MRCMTHRTAGKVAEGVRPGALGGISARPPESKAPRWISRRESRSLLRWRAKGGTHMYVSEGAQFYTRGNVVTSRWPAPAPAVINIVFPRTR